jgi:cytoskeletal protein CcmA (bactofilin family)
MAGNARFHDKLHRKNHHTNPTVGYADSASDPIASPSEPFQGDFVVNGQLSSNKGINTLSADIKGDLNCINIHVSGVTYTNFISGNSTETIISDRLTNGNGNNTLTLNYLSGIYGVSPFFSISNTLCSLGTITSPSATFDTLTVKTSTNLNGPLSVFGNTNLNGTLTVTGSSTINGKLSVGSDVNIKGNLLVTGNLSALGDTTQIDTNIVTTSALSVINYGTTSALVVNQIGNYPTAIFQKNSTDILSISGGLITAYATLTSTGNINSSNINLLQSTSGNWNSVYNSVLSTSGNWDKTYNFLTSGGKISGSFIASGDQTLSGSLGIGISALSARLHVYDNSNNPAVKITQLGLTGHALYIEDESGDGTPTVIDYAGHVGIGTTTPNKELTVVGDISATGTLYTHSSSYSLSSNGYTKLPNGLIMQWGILSSISIDETIYTVNFPKLFPNTVFNVTATLNYDVQVNGSIGVVVKSLSSSGFQVFTDCSNLSTTGSIYWNAIGY